MGLRSDAFRTQPFHLAPSLSSASQWLPPLSFTHQELHMPRVIGSLLGGELQLALLHRIEGGLELAALDRLVVQ